MLTVGDQTPQGTPAVFMATTLLQSNDVSRLEMSRCSSSSQCTWIEHWLALPPSLTVSHRKRLEKLKLSRPSSGTAHAGSLGEIACFQKGNSVDPRKARFMLTDV